jgi:hypothetical protein
VPARAGLEPPNFFFFIFGQPSSDGMVRPIKWANICQSLEEVTLHAGHEVLMGVDDSISLIVGDPQWILDQLLRSCIFSHVRSFCE